MAYASEYVLHIRPSFNRHWTENDMFPWIKEKFTEAFNEKTIFQVALTKGEFVHISGPRASWCTCVKCI
jgi:hypothetical protein